MSNSQIIFIERLWAINKKIFNFSTLIISIFNILADALKCFCRGHCPNLPSDVVSNIFFWSPFALNWVFKDFSLIVFQDGECYAKPGARCFASVEMVTDPATDLPVPGKIWITFLVRWDKSKLGYPSLGLLPRMLRLHYESFTVTGTLAVRGSIPIRSTKCRNCKIMIKEKL